MPWYTRMVSFVFVYVRELRRVPDDVDKHWANSSNRTVYVAETNATRTPEINFSVVCVRAVPLSMLGRRQIDCILYNVLCVIVFMRQYIYEHIDLHSQK